MANKNMNTVLDQRLETGGSRRLDYLDQLESESIHILREVAGQFERPALLFSGGKDSIVLVHLALKAFRPGKFPFPLMHIDTGHNFQEALDFRDKLVSDIGEKLIVRKVEDTIKFEFFNSIQQSKSLQSITAGKFSFLFCKNFIFDGVFYFTHN